MSALPLTPIRLPLPTSCPKLNRQPFPFRLPALSSHLLELMHQGLQAQARSARKHADVVAHTAALGCHKVAQAVVGLVVILLSLGGGVETK